MFNELMDGLGYIGSSLDKLGSRELRGALGGKPRELLSFVPFSDRLGITDPNDIQTGRSLLHKAGVLDESRTGWGPALAGMATEAALDPFTLLGGGKAIARGIGSAARGAENVGKLRSMLHVETNPEVLNALKASRPGQVGLNRGNYVASWGGPEVLNEEVNHGLTKMAALTGDSAGLPVQSKIAANLYRKGAEKQSPFRVGLADMMLESAGHTARKEGLGGLAEGAKYWLSPAAHQGYHNQIARYSPAAASVYHSAPGVVAGGIGGAGLGARSDTEDPVRGALLGGLAGAVGGGIASHAFYSPKGAAQAAHSGENASLGLKYDIEPTRFSTDKKLTWRSPDEVDVRTPLDARPEDFGLSRSDPEWVNNRTFYHGTATHGLSPQTLDISKTNPEGLYGRGIYTTDEGGRTNNAITRGYAESRVDDRISSMESEFASRDMIKSAYNASRISPQDLAAAMRFAGVPESAIERALSFEHGGSGGGIAERFRGRTSADGLIARASDPVRILLDTLKKGGFDPANPEPRELAGKILSSLGGWPSPPMPTIYQAQSDFGKILDLDKPATDVYDNIRDALRSKGIILGPVPSRSGEIGGAYDAAKYHLNPDQLTNVFTDLGYDALTHTGGQYHNLDPHQVVIGLNPQKYRRFEPLPEDELRKIFGNENAAFADWANDPLQHPAKEAYDKNAHLIGKDPNPFADAIDSLGLPRDVANRVFDARDRFETYGDPWISPDQKSNIDVLAGLTGDWFGNENAAMDPRFRPFPGADRELNDAADYLGPGYPPNRNLLEATDLLHSDHTIQDLLTNMSPEDQRRIIQEIPPGSKRIGSGTESHVLKTPGPNPWAIRLGTEVSPLHFERQYRPNIPGVLQATRSNMFGPSGSGVAVEHMPIINTPPSISKFTDLAKDLVNAGDTGLKKMGWNLEEAMLNHLYDAEGVGRHLADEIDRQAGWMTNVRDISGNYSNVGWHQPPGQEARFLTHDAGAVYPSNTREMLTPRPYTPGPPGRSAEHEATRLGAQDAVRQALIAGAKGGLEGQGLVLPGGRHFAERNNALLDMYNKAFAELMMYRADTAGANAPWQGF